MVPGPERVVPVPTPVDRPVKVPVTHIMHFNCKQLYKTSPDTFISELDENLATEIMITSS